MGQEFFHDGKAAFHPQAGAWVLGVGGTYAADKEGLPDAKLGWFFFPEVQGGKGKANDIFGFSLIIRADNGSTLLETHVDYMHQAFQRLIDWSINETCQDVCAVITGPNGFYKKHQIKASRDFDWIESKESVFRGVSAGLP